REDCPAAAARAQAAISPAGPGSTTSAARLPAAAGLSKPAPACSAAPMRITTNTTATPTTMIRTATTAITTTIRAVTTTARMILEASCPALCRASTPFFDYQQIKDVDGRDKPGHYRR